MQNLYPLAIQKRSVWIQHSLTEWFGDRFRFRSKPLLITAETWFSAVSRGTSGLEQQWLAVFVGGKPVGESCLYHCTNDSSWLAVVPAWERLGCGGDDVYFLYITSSMWSSSPAGEKEQLVTSRGGKDHSAGELGIPRGKKQGLHQFKKPVREVSGQQNNRLIAQCSFYYNKLCCCCCDHYFIETMLNNLFFYFSRTLWSTSKCSKRWRCTSGANFFEIPM